MSRRTPPLLSQALVGCLALAAAVILPGCTEDPDSSSDTKAGAARSYQATIRWTSHGIPHITAKDLGSVAFGQGYAYAQQNACTLADQITKVRSERAKFLGRGDGDVHLKSDLAYAALQVRERAKESWDTQLSADAKAMVEGYVAGFNQRLKEVGPGGLPAACKDAAWVRPLEPLDLVAYYQDLAIYASGRQLKAYLLAEPPKLEGAWLRLLDPAQTARSIAQFQANVPHPEQVAIGSNGWGIGAEKSASGKGLLVANPHFPWFGELRLWESHLTVPGQLDAYGATLSGVVGILIGFNQDVAWTETVSASKKFTLYRLKLDAKDPTSYLVDGKTQKMTSHTATIEVKNPDGTLEKVTRTFWRTSYGPIVAIPDVAEWTSENAYALRDANEHNGKLLDHFLGFARAKSVEDVAKVCETVQANPWTNTMAADRHGGAFYTESHSTPNLSAEAVADHKKALADADLLTMLAQQQGFVLLDGTKPSHQWVEEKGSREPGLTPWQKTPHLLRKDFVVNANDSHWLTNPAQPLEGYGYLFGPERTARSLRTRQNLRLMLENGPNAASGPDGKWTADELAAMVLSGRHGLGDVYGADLQARCAGEPVTLPDGVTVDLAPACQVLAGWDRTQRPDAKGAVLVREWFGQTGGSIAEVPFDPNDPVHTPSTLKKAPAKGADPMRVALAQAVRILTKAGRKLDAPLSELQFTLKDGEKIAVPGGYHGEGAFNVIGWTSAANDTLLPKMTKGAAVADFSSLTADGYPINYGTSFVMVLAFGDQGPQARALLTYGQTTDPATEGFKDQTKLFGLGQFRKILFTDAEIAQDAGLKTVTVERK